MSTLHERMIQDMQLRGFSARTQQAYARAVRKLAEHYQKSPDGVTDEELRQYFLHCTNVSRWSRVACTIALCGVKFFYEQTLSRDWTTVGLAKPKRVKSLPIVLSLEEVRRALACVHMFRHRVCLATIYSCGLRLSEGRTLQIPDIDRADILRLHGPAYLAKYHDRLLPSHRRAIQAICACRTPPLGGHLYRCPQCQQPEDHPDARDAGIGLSGREDRPGGGLGAAPSRV